MYSQSLALSTAKHIPLYGYTTICLTTHWVIDIWVISSLELIMNNAA